MASMQGSTIVATLPDRTRAEAAARELRDAGFDPSAVRVATEPGELTAAAGLPAEDARRAAERLQAGGAAVVVRAGDRFADAVRVLRDYGAEVTGPAAEAVGGYDTAAETAGTMGTRPVEPGETDRTGGLRVDTGAGPRPAAGPQGPGEDVDEGGEKVGRDEVLTEGGDWDVE
ncbi:MAG: hypothetical protein IRY97_05000, partial [Thermomicrobiaceae bacterium]|nr:hypothetical protein [Thermomicrobiaceae bacterium]